MRLKDTTAFGIVAVVLLYWNAACKMIVLTQQPVYELVDVLLLPIRQPSGFILPALIEIVFSISQLAYARKKELVGMDRWVYFGLVVFSAWLSFLSVGPIYARYFGGGELAIWVSFGLCILIDFLAEQMLKQVVV